jgi:hypothetical protein
VKRAVFSTNPPTSHKTTPTHLARQMDTIRNLALYGAEDVARELCAAIFLKHTHTLASSRDSWVRFVECVLLLGMHNLLTRLLRATHGAGVSASNSGTHGGRLALSLSNGSSLLIPALRADAGVMSRLEHAAHWSERILAAAVHAESGSSQPPDPLELGHRAGKPSFASSKLREHDPVGH